VEGKDGDTIEIQACTQSPYMDRADIAKLLGLPAESVRIIPTAVGGGFGTKLDLSVQPFIALAAWHLHKPVRMVYSRIESIMSTTKRHPSKIHGRVGATQEGKLVAAEFTADFNTGAYSSWGPTVAARVPVHASGPYVVPNYRASPAPSIPTWFQPEPSAASVSRKWPSPRNSSTMPWPTASASTLSNSVS